MKIEQFVMAYRVDHGKVKALLSEDYESLRPVLRINIEIIHDEKNGTYVRIEHNTPVASQGKRGWLNLNVWEYCDCEFRWTKPVTEAMRIPPEELLGAYKVAFER